MKTQSIRYWLAGVTLLVAALVLDACDESEYREPSGAATPAPAQVTEVRVKNRPGKATIM